MKFLFAFIAAVMYFTVFAHAQGLNWLAEGRATNGHEVTALMIVSWGLLIIALVLVILALIKYLKGK